MRISRRPRVGLLGVMLELYDKSSPELRPAQEQFAGELAGKLGEFADVTNAGVHNTREGVDAAVQALERADVDLIVTVHLAYAPSLILVPSLLRTSKPLVLWNTQRIREIGGDFSHADLLQNHGMHGVQDLANALRRNGRAYEVVTSHWEDPAGLEELREWAVAARTVRELAEARIGLIGHPFPGMGDFGVDETSFLSQVGPDVRRVGCDELAEAWDAAPDPEVRALVAQDRERFEIDPELTDQEHYDSARWEWTLRRLTEDLGLSGWAVHYPVIAADPRFEVLPFLAVAKLIADGYGFGGEGDIVSSSAVLAMQCLFEEATFTEMFCMDFEHEEILMSHYAESNWRMARADRPVRVVRREGWVGSGGPSAALAHSLEPGEATLLNLTIGPEGAQVIIAEAEITDFALPDLPTPHFKIALELPIAGFLNNYTQAGGSHHLALAYGRGTTQVLKLARLLELPHYVT